MDVMPPDPAAMSEGGTPSGQQDGGWGGAQHGEGHREEEGEKGHVSLQSE